MTLKNKQKFSPKKKVISGLEKKRKGNIVGFFSSKKMGCAIHYQSLAECRFLYKLELDPDVTEYYPQPVEVPVFVSGVDKDEWQYVPDCLAFYSDGIVKLYEIKYNPDEFLEPKQVLRENAAKAYCKLRGWEYETVCPTLFNPIFTKNLDLLIQYIHPHPGLGDIEEKILSLVDKSPGGLTIKELTEKLFDNCKQPPKFILPHLYHLIAVSKLEVDMHKPINTSATIKIAKNKVFIP